MGIVAGARFEVDTSVPVRLNRWEYYVSGWILPAKDTAESQRLCIELDGVAFPVVTGLRRNDVAGYFRDAAAGDCGFVARFRLPRIRPYIRLMLQAAQKEFTLAEFQKPPGLRPATKPGNTCAPDYHRWVTESEPDEFWPAYEVNARLSALPRRPLLSVVVVARSATPYLLSRCITSVLQQCYVNVQLCIVVDCRRDPRIAEYLEITASTDPRITLLPDANCNGAACCLAELLPLVQGEYVIWIREDDELHPHALLEVVRHVNRYPDASIVYSDEDSINIYGNRTNPLLKPSFDSDMFSCSNYVGHLTALKRGTLGQARDLLTLREDAEYWDLLLRASGQGDARTIQHIPKILYHRRVYDAATTIKRPGTSNSQVSNTKLIAEHLKRTGMNATAEPGIFGGSVRVRYSYPAGTRIGIFLRAHDGRWQAAVLSQQPDEGSRQFYEIAGCAVRGVTPPKVSGTDLPFLTLDETPEDVFVFINRPLETVNHFFISELVSQAMRSDCGIAAGISLDLKNRILHAGLMLKEDGSVHNSFFGTQFPPTLLPELNSVRGVDGLSDHFFAVRRDGLAVVGGLACISESTMERLVFNLVKSARDRNLRVIVTPYAIATFECMDSGNCPGSGIDAIENPAYVRGSSLV